MLNFHHYLPLSISLEVLALLRILHGRSRVWSQVADGTKYGESIHLGINSTFFHQKSVDLNLYIVNHG